MRLDTFVDVSAVSHLLPDGVGNACLPRRDRRAGGRGRLRRRRVGGRHEGRNGRIRRRGSRREAEPVQVEARRVKVDAQHVLARRQADAALGDGRPGLPCAGIGHRQRPGDVRTVHLKVELACAAGRGNTEAGRVGTAGLDVDRVLQPLPGGNPADVITRAGIGGRFNIDVIGSIGVAGVAGCSV